MVGPSGRGAGGGRHGLAVGATAAAVTGK
ncbi:hypothetical protein DESC_320048 [Desulfosarcina cetonica]|nr:hypothetical protein DESC_320048 [Desulfosarcina cetonica]